MEFPPDARARQAVVDNICSLQYAIGIDHSNVCNVSIYLHTDVDVVRLREDATQVRSFLAFAHRDPVALSGLSREVPITN